MTYIDLCYERSNTVELPDVEKLLHFFCVLFLYKIVYIYVYCYSVLLIQNALYIIDVSKQTERCMSVYTYMCVHAHVYVYSNMHLLTFQLILRFILLNCMISCEIPLAEF